MFKTFAAQFRQPTRLLSLGNKLFTDATSTSFAATSKLDETPSIPVKNALEGWHKKFKKAGVGGIDFNLKCMVAHVLGKSFLNLPNYDNLHFTAEQLVNFQRLCEARCARMPLQHILGEWEFMNLTLKTAPTVFIPRPETEEFVQKVINVYKDVEEPIKMLEVGCGSGAMSLAILHAIPNVVSTAIERSKLATKLAFENSQLVKLDDRFKVYNHTMVADQLMPEHLANEKYDLIISNPPYVKTEEFPLLNPEVVVYENLNALDGGPDGLKVARLVLDLACVHLRMGGKLWLELGSDHPQMVKTIISSKYADRLRFVSSFKDQYDRERFVELEKI